MESSSTKGNIRHGKLKSQKELKKITGSEDYKKSDYEGKTKMLNVATANKGMSVRQKKLAAKAPPPNKLDEKDLAVLRAEKAKGRGMGLQDEKVKPGKVMKAKKGKLFQGYLSTFDASAEASTPKAQRGVTTIVGVRPGAKIGKGKKKFKSMEAMRTAKGFKTIDGKQETSSEFNKRRMMLAGAKQASKATTIGKIVLPIAAAGVAAQQYLKSKMKKKDEPKKKMGGGMMQKPMGFKHGTKPGPLGGLGIAGNILQKRIAAGRPASPSQQQKKKKETDIVLMMPVKEGPANRNTTIKEFTVKRNMGGGMMKKPMGYKIGTGEKPLETAMNKKRAEQTENVKRLTTQSDAYDPEMRFLHASKNTRSGSSNVLRTTTDQVNLKEARNKFKEELPRGFNVRIKTSKEMRPRRDIAKYSKGGGMMNKPMGYKHGTMVKARGCKLGRTRPTKIY